MAGHGKDFDITIIGLGPGDLRQLTIEAQQALREASEVYLRTRQHPVIASLPATLPLHSFDYLYEQKASFGEIYQGIAERILDLARRPEGVVYAVPGHPLVAEESVCRILALARQQHMNVRLVSAVSFLDSLFFLLELDPLAHGLQVMDATSLAAYSDAWHGTAEEEGRRHPAARLWSRRPFDPTAPLVIAQLYSPAVASAVKLVLQEFYPHDHTVVLARWAGVADQEEKRSFPLFELDRQPDVDYLTSLYVAPLDVSGDLAALAGLRHIIARLRAPGGCPWDRKQSHESLKPYLLEETYEVVEALDLGDKDMLCEELGDLLLQIVLHSQLATETGDFMLEDVFRGINSKLIRRHPHVFGERIVADAAEVVRNWEQIKREEKGEKGEPTTSTLSSVPKAMPALSYSESIQKRAARVGFDWASIEGVLDKVAEELREIQAASTPEERQEEYGDLLFALVNVARWLDIDAEDALRMSSQKFVRRFERMEEICAERGLSLDKLSPAEIDYIWEEAKQSTSERQRNDE